MLKTAIVLGALVMVAGCSKPAQTKAVYYAVTGNVSDEAIAIKRGMRLIDEPWPTVKPEAQAHAVRWAKLHNTEAAWNCLNPRWAGADKPCGADPVFCADTRTNAPAAGYKFSPDERRCVKVTA